MEELYSGIEKVEINRKEENIKKRLKINYYKKKSNICHTKIFIAYSSNNCFINTHGESKEICFYYILHLFLNEKTYFL